MRLGAIAVVLTSTMHATAAGHVPFYMYEGPAFPSPDALLACRGVRRLAAFEEPMAQFYSELGVHRLLRSHPARTAEPAEPMLTTSTPSPTSSVAGHCRQLRAQLKSRHSESIELKQSDAAESISHETCMSSHVAPTCAGGGGTGVAAPAPAASSDAALPPCSPAAPGASVHSEPP